MSMCKATSNRRVAWWTVIGLCLCCLFAAGDVSWSSEREVCNMRRELLSGSFPEGCWADGNALYIVDAGNHWVFAIDRTGTIVWSAGECGELGEIAEGLLGIPSFVQVTESVVVVADAAQGVVVEYTGAGEVVRMLDLGGLRLSSEYLPEIRSAFKIGPNRFLVADRNLHVVLLVVGKSDGAQLTWEARALFGTVGRSGRHGLLYSPTWAQPLRNGNVAIADSLNHRVIETDISGNVVRQHGHEAVGTVHLALNSPTCVSDIGDGRFLICDTGNRRVLQVDSSGEIVWELQEIKVPADVISLSSVVPLVEPIHAVYLGNGSTLITDRVLRDIYEVNADGELVWSYSLARLQHPCLPVLFEPLMAVPGSILLP